MYANRYFDIGITMLEDEMTPLDWFAPKPFPDPFRDRSNRQEPPQLGRE